MNQQPILRTQNLSIGYAKSRRKPPHIIADNLNLNLQKGELVCLLGANGVGKSTLLRTIAGMQPPLDGTIVLDSQNLSQLSVSQRAQHLSIVLTERPNVGLLSGYELVALGRHPYTDWTGRLTKDDERAIHNAIIAVDAQGIVYKPVAELSDGQRQKIWIARALAQDPKLILLDEPTAFLDLPRRVEIMQLLKDLAHTHDRAILLSTHDLDLALRTADKLWLMSSQGNIHNGTPEDCVLNGQFADTFAHEGVHFELSTGAFQMTPNATKSVKLTGDNPTFLWTQRALERNGYTLADDSSLHIQIDNNHWHIHTPTQQQNAHSIEELINVLNSHTEQKSTSPLN